MNQPLVSVIIPAYNASLLLGETIESVLNQTYSDWEMLIIDDASTDETVSVAYEYATKDPRIRVFSLRQNSGGPAGPRNHGLKAAQGRYAAFLDADDLWLPDKLQKQVSFLEAHQDVFLSYGRCIVEREGKQLRVEPQKPRSGYVFNDLLAGCNCIDCLTVMIRLQGKKAYLFDEDPRLVAVEDYAMWLTIAHENKIGFLDELLGIYRIHDQGISSGAFANFKKCRYVLAKFHSYVPKMVLLRAYLNFYRRLIFVRIMTILIQIKRMLVRRVLT